MHYAITRLTAHIMCGDWPDVWSGDLQLSKKYAHTCSYKTPNELFGITEQQKTQPILILMIVLYTFSEEAQLRWLYWQARSGITRIAKWTAVHFSNMERNAYEVWMCWNTQSHFKKVMCVIHQMFHLYLNWCNLQKEKITWQLHIYWIFDKMKTVYVCNALQHFFLTYECLFVSYTMQLYIST